MTPTGPDDDADDAPPKRESFFALIPRRSLMKALTLILLLIVIIYLQRHTGSIAKRFSDALAPAPPATEQEPRPSEEQQK